MLAKRLLERPHLAGELVHGPGVLRHVFEDLRELQAQIFDRMRVVGVTSEREVWAEVRFSLVECGLF